MVDVAKCCQQSTTTVTCWLYSASGVVYSTIGDRRNRRGVPLKLADMLYTFSVAFRVVVTSGDRNFKFGTGIDRNKSYRMDNKSPKKAGVVWLTWPIFASATLGVEKLRNCRPTVVKSFIDYTCIGVHCQRVCNNAIIFTLRAAGSNDSPELIARLDFSMGKGKFWFLTLNRIDTH